MGTRLFVGNLSFDTSEATLRSALTEGGRVVKDLHMPHDRESGRPRGFAFADMGSESDAASAIKALHGASLDGRALKVNEAEPRPPRRTGDGRQSDGARGVSADGQSRTY